MKTAVLTLTFIVSVRIIAFGQEYSKEFGKIGTAETSLAKYEPDVDAAAVVLFDIANSHFVETTNSFDVVYERATRIKILSEAGIQWAEVEIPFYHEGNIYEKVYDIEAYAYNNENGQRITTSLNPSNTFDEKINNYWNYKKFAIPNVKEGSIIEYRYKISSQYKFNFRDWEFQWKIPVIFSQYEVKLIPFYEYTFLLQGTKKLDIQESYEDKGMSRNFGAALPYGNNSYNDIVYKFGMKNLPAFNDEEFITSINDYIIKLDFQLSKIHSLDGVEVDIITTWEDLIKELLKNEDFGKYIKKSDKLAPKLLDTNNLAKKTQSEKFNDVLDFVKGNFNWNNENDKVASKTPNKFVEDKFGNCADINLFAIGLLNNVGIEAYPLLISTRDHGKIKDDYPFRHFFNYVLILAKVEDKFILSDATEIYCLNDRIPSRCINDKGLIINDEKLEWVSLECLFPSTTTTFLQIKMDDNKQLETKILTKATEYDALYYRNRYTNNIETIKEKEAFKNYSIIDSTIRVQNYPDKTMPYSLKYTCTASPEIVNDKIYISPLMHESFSDNPLKQKSRTYPIDMTYPKKRIFTSAITIPDGYQVDFVPGNSKIDNDLFELSYVTSIQNNQLQVAFVYYFKKPVYMPADYSKLKYYFNEIIKKGTEKVVLTKTL